LATREPLQKNGAGTKSRTRDLLITSQLLYQLSYAGVSFRVRILGKCASECNRKMIKNQKKVSNDVFLHSFHLESVIYKQM
jgi:hypothetical protein